MATSGVFSGLDTVQQIVTDALIELQVLSANQTPRDSDMQVGLRRLNWMLKQWQDDGVSLWRQGAVTITWPANTPEADLETLASPITGVNDIVDLSLVVSGTYRRTMTRWELSDYLNLPNRAAPGDPSVYTVTRELATTRLRVWPVPTTTKTFEAEIDRRIEDVTLATQTVDVPQQYTRTVMMNLAGILGGPFGKLGEPHGAYVVREAARLYQVMRANDRPASYFMMPEGASYGR